MGKVRYGIENVYYALIKSTGEFDTPKPLKGAVSLTLDAEGDSNKFYADDTAYAVFETNAGYTGTLTIASLEDDARADLLKEVKDANGGVYEQSDAKPAAFALLYKIKGNVCDQNFAFYNSTLTRPSLNANTTSDSTDPDTVELPISCIPLEMAIGEETKKVTKYSMERTEANKTVYDAWFTTVQKPTAVIGA
jgi:phi13 family phage major tail protein